jgi:hypothetical protein
MIPRWACAATLGCILCACSTSSPIGASHTDGSASPSGDASDDASLDAPSDARSGDEGDADVLRDFDLGRDFSPTMNPNGVWRYGFTMGASVALDQFVLDTFTTNTSPLDFWHPAMGTAGYYPYVAANTGTVTTTDSTGSWAVRAGEIAMEASGSGQSSVIEFVVPQAGMYRIQADFEAIHFRLSTTDAHVRVGGASLFDANIDGYGGDPAFHAITGTNPRASYSGTLALGPGEVVSFVLGYGTDRTVDNDTTGLVVHIWLLR